MENLTSLNLTNTSTPGNVTAIGTALNPPRDLSMFLLSTDWAWLLRYALPVTVALGIFGNTVTFLTIILRRLYKKSAIFVFFAFISINDLLYDIIIGLVDVIDVHTQRNYLVTSDILCAFRLYSMISSSVASVWVLVAAAMYKLYVLAFPMNAYCQESTKTSLITCMTITATVYLAYTHLFWVGGMNVKGIIEDTPFIDCYILGDMFPAYESAFIAADQVIYSLLPAVLLLASSIAIIIFFTRSYLQHKKLMTQESNTPTRISPAYRSTRFTVLMILPVSILFIVLTLPLSMTSIIYYIHDPNDNYMHITVTAISMYCIQLNHSVNVYLQFSISSSFRDALLGRKSPGTRIGQRAAAILKAGA